MRTAVYVDGYNLYYIRLKGLRYFRWLNLKALADEILKPSHVVTVVNYYTADVSHKEDPYAPGRQRSYLNALWVLDRLRLQREQRNAERPRCGEHSFVIACQLDFQTALSEKFQRRHV